MKSPLEYQKAVSIPPLAPTLSALGDEVREALSRVSGLGFRHVQLSALQPGTRPKDLDQSGRRDLAATLKRMELTAVGVDCWVPPEHFLDAERVDRAVSAVCSAIELAGDLGRVAVSLAFPVPEKNDSEASANHPVVAFEGLSNVIATIGSFTAKHGIKIADHAIPVQERGLAGVIGIGIDTAAAIAAHEDPARIIPRHAEHLVCVRISDLHRNGMRGPIGDRSVGRLDVLELRVAITMAIGMQPVVLDARQWADPWSGITSSKDSWEES